MQNQNTLVHIRKYCTGICTYESTIQHRTTDHIDRLQKQTEQEEATGATSYIWNIGIWHVHRAPVPLRRAPPRIEKPTPPYGSHRRSAAGRAEIAAVRTALSTVPSIEYKLRHSNYYLCRASIWQFVLLTPGVSRSRAGTNPELSTPHMHGLSQSDVCVFLA